MTERLIIEMYRQMHRAMVSADIQVLSTLLADDFRLIQMTGYDQSRKEWLEHINARKMRYFSSDELKVNVKMQGEEAQLVGQNFVRASIWGAQGTWPLQMEIKVVRVVDVWQMKTAHASTFFV